MPSKRWTRLVAALGAATMALTACGSDDEPEETPAETPEQEEPEETPDEEPEPDDEGDGDAASSGPSGTVRYGLNFIPDDWNNLTKPGEGYLALVYEKLVTLEADGVTVVPQLAESWEEEPDAITLNLRQDVTFSDGTPFDADVVVANIERVSSTPGAWQYVFDAVEEVVVEDEYTIRLELSRPDLGLMPNLARRGAFMLSPAAIEDGTFAAPVGTGPWTLVPDETVADSIYVFEYFEDYWAPDEVGPERIEMVVILENEARLNAVVSGDVDVASIELPSVAQADSAGLDTTTWPALRHHLNLLDLEGAFSDVRVRQAICMGFNWDDIDAAQYDGYSEWKSQRHNPGQVGHNEDVPGYSYDPELAQELMDEAGNPDVTFSMPAADSQASQSQIFASQLAEIGITVEVDSVTSPQYFSTYQSGDYQSYFNTSSAEDAGIPGYYHFKWTEGGTANPFNVSVPELDELIERGFAATSLDEQTEIWEEFTQTVYDLALDCGFYDLPHAAAWNPDKLSGVQGQVWFPSHLRYREFEVLS